MFIVIVCHTPTPTHICHTLSHHSAPVHLSLDSPQCWFMPFSLAIENGDLTSSNKHRLPHLSCQAVFRTASNLGSVVSWLSLMFSILVFLHKRFFGSVPISVCVLLAPCLLLTGFLRFPQYMCFFHQLGRVGSLSDNLCLIFGSYHQPLCPFYKQGSQCPHIQL